MNTKNIVSKQISLFTTAGYPELNSLPYHLSLFEQKGVDFVEVGIPFSDPLADGPTIQESSAVALSNGMNLNVLFDQLEKRSSTIPIVLMGYINPVLQFGLENFLKRAKEVGASGFVLPDLSIELYESRYQSLFEKYDIPVNFLITPSSENSRIRRSAELSKDGFVYLISSNSTTGSVDENPVDLGQRYKEIKELCGNTKVMIGFGIKDRATFIKKTESVDGGIIGSAFIKAAGKGEEDLFLSELTQKNS